MRTFTPEQHLMLELIADKPMPAIPEVARHTAAASALGATGTPRARGCCVGQGGAGARKRLDDAKAEALAASAVAQKRADDEARAKAEAERQRVALLEQQAQEATRKVAEAEATRKRLADAAPTRSGADGTLPRPGFRDCAQCPEIVVVPAGSFMMGSEEYTIERPVHNVTIAKPFAVGKFEVTFAEWDACVAAGGCKHAPGDGSWGRGNRPVMNMSWQDVTREYLPWLSRTTGKSYRLLSEAEREYAARASSQSKYGWGDDIGKNRASFDGCGSQWDLRQTAPVGSFAASVYGIFDMHGNVGEWVQDCWHDNYHGAPTDGSAWTKSCSGISVIVRGGSFIDVRGNLRPASRLGSSPDLRSSSIGFRVARTLD